MTAHIPADAATVDEVKGKKNTRGLVPGGKKRFVRTTHRLEGGEEVSRSANGRVQGKLALLSRESLDGRTRAAHLLDKTTNKIVQELGGEERLTERQKRLVGAYVCAALMVDDMTTRHALGESINREEMSNALSAVEKPSVFVDATQIEDVA
jgi:hypothetical protein